MDFHNMKVNFKYIPSAMISWLRLPDVPNRFQESMRIRHKARLAGDELPSQSTQCIRAECRSGRMFGQKRRDKDNQLVSGPG